MSLNDSDMELDIQRCDLCGALADDKQAKTQALMLILQIQGLGPESARD